MGLKAFLLIVLAILLVITSEVAARKLVQRSITSLEKGTTSEVNDAKFLGLPVGGGGLPGIGGGGGGGLPGIGGGGGLPGIVGGGGLPGIGGGGGGGLPGIGGGGGLPGIVGGGGLPGIGGIVGGLPVVGGVVGGLS
ncbi:hypothetical protein KY290_037888 [Solanum tuberosum]|uniref:Uncharacterized protein n=1 Tax=Solanum tuberosum TaxID=4113 RepID=A0ABQ7TXG4_SOLTU|nr:hypothetical protein KY289_037465 [Solanum tuberosum]KAH0739183.1 hypothetical protein KY290_037888 [Solanum tuberosum]